MTLPRQTPDRMLRESLRDKDNLREFLASARPELIDNFDFDLFREVPREVFAGDWHEREADLIFEVGYRVEGRTVPAVVGILMEHQSDTETSVPLRSLYMLAHFWERQWRQWNQLPSPRPPLRLSPAYSVVLYTAERAWGSNTNVRELLDEPAALHPFAPDWGPVFWNLSERSVEALLAGGAWMQLMAVMRATAEEREEFERVLREAGEHLAPLSESDHVRWSRLFRAVMTHVVFRRPAEEHPQLREVLEQTQTRVEEVREMAKTMVEVWMEQGELKGKLGLGRDTLRAQLITRFGPLPEPLANAIAALDDPARLQAALVRVVQINSLDEFHL